MSRDTEENMAQVPRPKMWEEMNDEQNIQVLKDTCISLAAEFESLRMSVRKLDLHSHNTQGFPVTPVADRQVFGSDMAWRLR